MAKPPCLLHPSPAARPLPPLWQLLPHLPLPNAKSPFTSRRAPSASKPRKKRPSPSLNSIALKPSGHSGPPFGAAIRGHSGPSTRMPGYPCTRMIRKHLADFENANLPRFPLFEDSPAPPAEPPPPPKIRLGENSRPRQSHTTKHAGQCPAVRRVERLTNTRSRNPKRSIRQCHTKPRRVRQPPRNTGPSRRLCGQVLPTPRSLNSANRVVPRF